MVDPTLQPKTDEQYPLLKIDGGGDISHAQTVQALATAPVWGVSCTKNSRFSRWPEFISACWMTLILCGISFLVFHALGMGFYRRHQLVVMKCNTSKPASNVFYHNIIHRGSMIPFVQYTEYLANMATLYPLLHFNVFFLIDDYYPDGLRSSRRYPYVPPYHSWMYNHKLDEIIIGVDAYTEFLKRYQNVNVTIISLSKYMAMTPLKYKWRLIPQAHLAFYARVFSVWQNGGIGIDLRTFNNNYHSHQMPDRRIDTILKQHNYGINAADYTNDLKKIDSDEANAIFTMFTGLINNLLNETRSFFNRTLLLPSFSNEKSPLIRTHRSKRQISNTSENGVGASSDQIIFYNIDSVLNQPSNHSKDKGQTFEMSVNATTTSQQKSVNSTALTNATQFNGNGSETHQVVLFYDFQILSEGDVIPSHNNFMNKPSTASKRPSHLLSIDAEGTFIAASSKLHPFLAHLTSAGCFGLNPKFAIQDALLTQCSGLLKDDIYCNNIYIL